MSAMLATKMHFDQWMKNLSTIEKPYWLSLFLPLFIQWGKVVSRFVLRYFGWFLLHLRWRQYWPRPYDYRSSAIGCSSWCIYIKFTLDVYCWLHVFCSTHLYYRYYFPTATYPSLSLCSLRMDSYKFYECHEPRQSDHFTVILLLLISKLRWMKFDVFDTRLLRIVVFRSFSFRTPLKVQNPPCGNANFLTTFLRVLDRFFSGGGPHRAIILRNWSQLRCLEKTFCSCWQMIYKFFLPQTVNELNKTSE